MSSLPPFITIRIGSDPAPGWDTPPTANDLRRAHRAAQQLAELLEMAGMDFEAQVARDIRQRCWQRLLELDPEERR